jgi:hypothetical protein
MDRQRNVDGFLDSSSNSGLRFSWVAALGIHYFPAVQLRRKDDEDEMSILQLVMPFVQNQQRRQAQVELPETRDSRNQ